MGRGRAPGLRQTWGSRDRKSEPLGWGVLSGTAAMPAAWYRHSGPSSQDPTVSLRVGLCFGQGDEIRVAVSGSC